MYMVWSRRNHIRASLGGDDCVAQSESLRPGVRGIEHKKKRDGVQTKAASGKG